MKVEASLRFLVFILGAVLFLFLWSKYSKNQSEAQNKQFEESGVYTIGKVIEYYGRTGGTNGGSSAFIRFAFMIDGVEYDEESGGDVPSEDGPEAGTQYMAIYLPNDPKKCALLLDYPIKDSTDFKKYMEIFKTNPPKLGD